MSGHFEPPSRRGSWDVPLPWDGREPGKRGGKKGGGGGVYFLALWNERGKGRTACDERKIDERGKRVSVCVGRERATWLFLCYIHRSETALP